MPLSGPESSPTQPGHSPLPQEDLSRDPLLRDLPRDAQGRPLLGRIPLVCRIGKGGMGAVYYALHPRLQVEVAVKVLPFHLLDEDPKLAERFAAEARMAAGLSNHHVVRVLDVDEEKGTHYLVMEYVAGESAGAYLKRRKGEGKASLEEREALEIVTAAAKGLAAAHERGIIHRDVKPDNILIPKGRDGSLDFRRAKVADLGLAKPEGGAQSLGTLSHIAMGTPGYMAPEQIEDARTAGRPADVFSLGATLYGLLSGQAPFRGTSLGVVLRDTMTKEPDPLPDRVGVSTRELISRCLAKDQAARPSDAGELLRSLESLGPWGGAPAPSPPGIGSAPAFEKTALFPDARSTPKTASTAPGTVPTVVLGAGQAQPPADPSAPAKPKRGVLVPLLAVSALVAAGALGAVQYLRKPAPPSGGAPAPHEAAAQKDPDPRVDPKALEKEIETKSQEERRLQRKRDFDATAAQAQAEKSTTGSLALWKLATSLADDPKDLKETQARVAALEAVLARRKEFDSVSALAREEHDLKKRRELLQKAEGLADTDARKEQARSQIKEVDLLIGRKQELDRLMTQARAEGRPELTLKLLKEARASADDPKDLQEIQKREREVEGLLGRRKEYESASAAARAEADPAKALPLWQKAEGLADGTKEREEARAKTQEIGRKLGRRRQLEAAVARAGAEIDPATALGLWKQARALADDPKDVEEIQNQVAALEGFLSRKKEFDAAAAAARSEKDDAKALEAWQRAAALADAAPDQTEARDRITEINKRFAKQDYDKGVAALNRSDFQGAVDWLSKAIDRDPTFVYAFSYRAMARRRKGDYEGAIEDYTRAVELDPKYATGYANRGNAKFEKHDYDGAIGDYSKAIELEPKNALLYKNRGNVRLRKGDQAGANADFVQAAQLGR